MAKKRPSGEGSLRKLPSGSWHAQISVQGRRLSFTHKSQAAVLEWIRETRGLVQQGLTYKGATMTVAEYLESWLAGSESSVRPGTARQYAQVVRDHIAPYIGRVKLAELGPGRIQALYAARQKAGAGARTVKLIHSVLHRALKKAVDLSLLVRNPAASVDSPRYDHAETKVLDGEQVSRLLLAARGTRNEALYRLAVATGMRQAELLALRWPDLDFQSRRLQISQQIKRPKGGGWQFAPLKTRQGRRTISLGEQTLEALRLHLDRQYLERMVYGEAWADNDLVFPSTVGAPQNPSNVLKGFKKLLRQAGLPEVRFHDLRHTAASLMLNAGIPVIVVSRRLGHAKPSITLDLYGHLMPDAQASAADTIDDLISPVEVGVAVKDRAEA